MTERVGNKRPPVHTRFKKGQSGNPRGRPKGSLNFRTDLVKELAEAIVVNEGGAKRKITKQRAFIKAMMARALQGDMRATNSLLIAIARLLPPPEPEPALGSSLSTDDEAILAAFLDHYRKQDGDKDE
jgi:hypothetical protein